MKRLLFLILIFSIHSTEIKEKKLAIKETKILFTSTTDDETIKGIGKISTGEISLAENKFQIEIDISDWRTSNSLQTKHMHDNYLETETFPKINYSGILKSYSTQTGEAELVGNLKLHGVEKKDFTTKGKLVKKGEEYIYTSDFIINLKEFKIDVPKLLFLKINENIQVQTRFVLKGDKI